VVAPFRRRHPPATRPALHPAFILSLIHVIIFRNTAVDRPATDKHVISSELPLAAWGLSTDLTNCLAINSGGEESVMSRALLARRLSWLLAAVCLAFMPLFASLSQAATWIELHPEGTPPALDSVSGLNPPAFYDATNNRLILFFTGRFQV